MPDTSPFQVRLPLTAPQSTPETSAIVWPAADPDAPAVILAPGAGTGMAHRLVRRHAGDLSEAGVAVALFNFAYTEVGRKRPDPATRLESAWRDVIVGLRPHLGPQPGPQARLHHQPRPWPRTRLRSMLILLRGLLIIRARRA